MQATDADFQQLFHALKLGLSRAVAACAPRSDLDDLEHVIVTLECAMDAPRITSKHVAGYRCIMHAVHALPAISRHDRSAVMLGSLGHGQTRCRQPEGPLSLLRWQLST